MNLSRLALSTPSSPGMRRASSKSLASSSEADLPKSLSVCPSATPMFNYLYHAIAHWERQLFHRPSDGTNIDMCHSRSCERLSNSKSRARANGGRHSPESVSKVHRRMTVPSVRVLEYESNVVTLDTTLYADSTDLDDISQPDNGMAADQDPESPSDSDSDASNKDEEPENIVETNYSANENEVLGTVGIFLIKESNFYGFFC